jgi:hypothetical protein
VDHDVARLAQLFMVIGMFTAAMTLVGALAKKVFDPPRTPKPRDQAAVIDEARFARLEDAVETIAVEVERIAEAQRFSAKLLAERARQEQADRGRALQEPISRS